MARCLTSSCLSLGRRQRDLAALATAAAAALACHQLIPMTFSAELDCCDLLALIRQPVDPFLYGWADSPGPAESLCMALEMLLVASSLPLVAVSSSCLICCCNVIQSAPVAILACCQVMRLLLLPRISRACN